MADKYQTQCPHCGVKFPITRQQLDMAKGNVRCGSCLQLFQASQHLLPLAESPAPTAGTATARPAAPVRPAAPATPAKPAAPVKPVVPPRPAASAPTRETDDDLADMILQELDTTPPPPEPAARRPAPPPAGATPARPTAPPPATPPPSAEEAPGIDDDFQWSPSSPRPATTTSMPKVGLKLDDEMLSLDDPFEAGAPAGKASLTGDHNPAADESWARAMLGETDERDERVKKFVGLKAENLSISDKTGVTSKSELQKRLAELDGESGDLFGSQSTTADEDDEFGFLADGKLSSREIEIGRGETGADLSPAMSGQQVSWGQGVVWATLSVLLVVALFVQYATYNFDRLSRDESWRGFYESACGAIGCAVPAGHDVTRIQSANLVVRTHPEAAQALVVDAVIYNRASFDQPFPRLSLSFSDLDGNVLAGRVFAPTEYLKGELTADDAMPRDTPVHVSLEIIDPGSQAVGYALQFLPPESG